MIQLVENEWGIFWVNFKGKTSIESMLEFLQFAIDKGDLPKTLNALYDFSETEFIVQPDDITFLANEISKLTTSFKSIRTALVVNDPDKTAFTILFLQANTNSNTIREVFSTTEYAIDWLLYR